MLRVIKSSCNSHFFLILSVVYEPPENNMEAHHATKYPFEIVEAVRYARNIEKRSVKWIAERYDIPIDTLRDWLYRNRRVNE